MNLSTYSFAQTFTELGKILCLCFLFFLNLDKSELLFVNHWFYTIRPQQILKTHTRLACFTIHNMLVCTLATSFKCYVQCDWGCMYLAPFLRTEVRGVQTVYFCSGYQAQQAGASRWRKDNKKKRSGERILIETKQLKKRDIVATRQES